MSTRLTIATLVITVWCVPAYAESAPDAKETIMTMAGKLADALPSKLPASLVPTVVDEAAAGRTVAASLLAIAPLVADPGLQQYVNFVGRWLAAQSERPDLPWHFGVIESADLNAFACPGGYVLITKGLYDSLSDPAELAGVLAHEIAHVVARHHLRLALSSQLITEGARRAASVVKPGSDQVVQNLVGAGAGLMGRKLDKSSEFEADRMAVVLAARAGFDPFGLPAVLLKLEQLPAADDRVSLLFSTHPLPAERLRRLDAAMGDSLSHYGAEPGVNSLYR